MICNGIKKNFYIFEGKALTGRELYVHDNIGVAFMKIDSTGNAHKDFERRPLGEHLTHSETPNCKIILESGKFLVLKAIEFIAEDAPLTINFKSIGLGNNYVPEDPLACYSEEYCLVTEDEEIISEDVLEEALGFKKKVSKLDFETNMKPAFVKHAKDLASKIRGLKTSLVKPTFDLINKQSNENAISLTIAKATFETEEDVVEFRRILNALKDETFRDKYVLTTGADDYKDDKKVEGYIVLKLKGIKALKEAEDEENISGEEEDEDIISSARATYVDPYNTDIDVPENRDITPFFSKAELINMYGDVAETNENYNNWLSYYGDMITGMMEADESLDEEWNALMESMNYIVQESTDADEVLKAKNTMKQYGWNPDMEWNELNKFRASERLNETVYNEYPMTEVDLISEDFQLLMEEAEKKNLKPIFIVAHIGNKAIHKEIQKWSGSEASHVCVGFKPDLQTLYGFNPGGLKYESIARYVRERPGTSIKAFAMFMEAEKVEVIKQAVRNIISKKDKLKYNLIGLLGVRLDKPIKNANAMFCSEFVDSLLKLAKIDLTKRDSALVVPADFIYEPNNTSIFKIYEGTVEDFKPGECVKKVEKLTPTKSISDEQDNARTTRTKDKHVDIQNKKAEKAEDKTREPYMQTIEKKPEKKNPIQNIKNKISPIFKKKPVLANEAIDLTGEALTQYIIEEGYYEEIEETIIVEEIDLQEYCLTSILEEAKAKGLKPIFIMLTANTAAFSKIIRKVTDAERSHASISFKPSISTAYGFSSTGVQFESVPKYKSKNPDMAISIYAIFMEPKKVDAIKQAVREVMANKGEYKYSWKGLIGTLVNKPVTRSHNMFCSEFVDRLLKGVKIDLTKKPSALVTPADLDMGSDEKRNVYKIYEGPVGKFNPASAGKKAYDIEKSIIKKYNSSSKPEESDEKEPIKEEAIELSSFMKNRLADDLLNGDWYFKIKNVHKFKDDATEWFENSPEIVKYHEWDVIGMDKSNGHLYILQKGSKYALADTEFKGGTIEEVPAEYNKYFKPLKIK